MRPGFHICTLTICSLLLFFNAVPVNGQDTNPQSSISFSAGYSMPYGTFAEKSFSRMAGFSSGGPVMDFRYQHFYGRKRIFGLYADASFTTHFFSERSYLASYEEVMNVEGAFQVKTGNYLFAVTRLGILVAFPEFSGTRIILDAGLGGAFCYHRKLSVYNTYWGQINTVSEDVSGQLMSAAGVTIEHSLNRYTAILVSWSAYGFTPSFYDEIGPYQLSFDLPVRYMNFNLGISRYF